MMTQPATDKQLFEKMREVLRQYQANAAPPTKAVTAHLPLARLFTPQILAGHKWCQPLNAPIWSTTVAHMQAEDPVLGLSFGQQAWALPWWIMKNHHVANVIFHAQPVVITLCEMCSGSAAFASVHQEQVYTFHLAGQYNGTILIADDQTNSVWSPFTGQCLAGACKGQRLRRVPLVQCLWTEWQTSYPATQVLYGEQTLRQGHGSEFSPGSPGIDQSFCQTLVRPLDERLPHNILVLGVEDSQGGRAYPLTALDEQGYLYHDERPASEVVIFHVPGTMFALAFARRVDGELLAFAATDTGEIYDQSTGTCWNLMGEAIAGPLAGHKLTYLPSGVEEWYVWAAYHPETQIHGVDF